MMKKTALFVMFLLVLAGMSGCAIHSIDVQTLTIPPSKEPVTVTVKGDAKCQDFFLFYRVQEFLDVKASNGQHGTRIQ